MNSYEWHKPHWPLKHQSQNLFSTPAGVIQRTIPSKRTTMDTEEENVRMNFMDESEEFDSDQHIEDPNDWHDELDMEKMPHLLGPSATVYSSDPTEYQHFSYTAPPFSCQQILVQFDTFGRPSFSLVPRTYQQTFAHNNVYDNPEYVNYYNQY